MYGSLSPVAIGHGVGVAIDRVLLQPVEKTVQMISCSCSNVSSDDLVCMRYIRHVLLCTHVPREPDHVITGKCKIGYFCA